MRIPIPYRIAQGLSEVNLRGRAVDMVPPILDLPEKPGLRRWSSRTTQEIRSCSKGWAAKGIGVQEEQAEAQTPERRATAAALHHGSRQPKRAEWREGAARNKELLQGRGGKGRRSPAGTGCSPNSRTGSGGCCIAPWQQAGRRGGLARGCGRKRRVVPRAGR